MSQLDAQSNIHVRGTTSFSRPASIPLKILSISVDFLVILSMTTLCLKLFRIHPLPRLGVFVLFLLMGAIYWLPQRLFFGITLGERSWQLRIRYNYPYPLKIPLYQSDHLSLGQLLVSIAITLLTFFATGYSVRESVLKHPFWASVKILKMEPFFPPTSGWNVNPFFYTIGAWPKTFQGKPVFYTLLYEKAPPARFVGHIVANWSVPDIRVILEGPKTPEKGYRQRELRDCFVGQSSLPCIFRKEVALKRHVEEINALEPRSWNLQWFVVENPMIPKEDQVEGIYIQAIGDNWKQDRFIVITSNGTHQTIILHRPNTSQGEYASTLIQEAIRSMRTFNELYSGRAWINRDLEQIRLDDLQSLPSEMRIARLAEIQSLLISRITVEPGSYDSYFHLAGTSMILAQSARSNLRGIEPGLGVIALKNLENSYRYALDINPADKRTSQLQSLMLESRKN